MWIVWLEKKILKTLGILLGILLILIIALHIYLVNNAEYLLGELVRTRSDNKLGLKVKNISFNYFSNKIGLEKVSFYSNDTNEINTAYQFEIDRIQIRVNGLIPIFTKKQLIIDSLYLNAPNIIVTTLKKASAERKEVSVPAEMGRIYNSIIDALTLLHVTRFELNDGRFTLNSRVRKDQKPLQITNLHIHIDNLNIDSTETADNFFTGNQMEFRTRDQDILFPDGNHRLAFSKFRINIRDRQIEIDSCTFFGRQADNDKAGYTVFLDTLKLVNVDFKSLYEGELIKADSVYCLKPDILLSLDLKKGSGTGGIPNLDTLIKDLTGNMSFNYIGVKNADLNLTTYNDDRPSTFTSRNNNFEMEELVINHSLPQPVSLKSFSTAIRNYENFIKDSSFFLRFDSILLQEKQVLLSNFSINSEPYKDTRNIRVRRFALSGLSWEDLLFKRKVKARQATLYDPFIDYVQPELKRKSSKSLLASLEGIYRIMDLEKLQVQNGEIRVLTRDKDEFRLQNADLLITMPDPGTIDDIKELERVIDELYFEKGIFRVKNMTANADNSFYSGDKNQLSFDKINVYDKNQAVYLSARNVRLDSLSYDDSLNKLKSSGLYWSQGRIEINRDSLKKKATSDTLNVEINKSEIYNTAIDFTNPDGTLNISLSAFSTGMLSGGSSLSIDKLKAIGKELSWFKQGTEISFTDFHITDDSASALKSFHLKQEQDGRETEIRIPELEFRTDINSIVSGKPEFQSVTLNEPEINIRINAENTTSNRVFPDLKITNLLIEKPVFSLFDFTKGSRSLYWNGKQNRIDIKDVRLNAQENTASTGRITGSLSGFTSINESGKPLNSGNGEIQFIADQFSFLNKQKPEWSFYLKQLSAKNFREDSLGKQSGVLDIKTAKAENITVQSGNAGDLAEMIRSNQVFRLSQVTGSYVTQKNRLSWENLGFDREMKRITVDTISFSPIKSRDAFIFSSPWQTDYITISTGPVTMEGVDADRYFTDSTVRAREINISNAVFSSYRDKRPPFHAGIIKPLPSKLLQHIPFKLYIDTLDVVNGTAYYSELNDKTGETGNVPVTRISGDIFPIKNTEIAPTDSFRIRLNGYILDTAWLRLRTRESMIDSLSGFIITLRMRPQSMLYLNEALLPLAGVSLKSGFLDTLNMRAIGKDNISLGEMRMFYHNLKLEFLRNGTEEKKRFLSGLKTFIANSFVIKNENKKRKGIVYFPRLRDRSFINYYIKIALSGIASSIGAKKNRKILRKYRKELKIRQLPPIDF